MTKYRVDHVDRVDHIITASAAPRQPHIDTIQCTDCNVWLHRKCTGLSQVQFSAFDGDNVPFECPRCIGRRDDGTVV